MKKVVIMSYMDQQQTYTPAAHEFSNFFLPFHYMQKLALRKKWSIATVIDPTTGANVTKAGCDFITDKDVIKRVSNFDREDEDLIYIIESECAATQHGKVIWKVVEIPDDVDYEILGTSTLNETLVYCDPKDGQEFVVVQKPDNERNDFGFPQNVLEEFLPTIGGKLLYNPNTKRCLQSFSDSKEIFSTRVIDRNSPNLANVVSKYLERDKTVNILNVEKTEGRVFQLYPAFEIAVPKDF